MFEIKKIDISSSTSKKDFYTSLKNTGFAVIQNHSISGEILERFYNSWAKFFNSKEKENFKFNPSKQDGFFPFRSENAKNNDIKDLKEFFHVYPKTDLPDFLKEDTIKVYKELVLLGMELLRWLDESTPKNIKELLSEPLIDMMSKSERNLLRVLHYPPIESKIEDGAIRAAAHEDINLITLLVSGSQPGLEAQDIKGNWHKVPVDKGMITVNVGDMLQMASGGFYPSTSHRVVNPENSQNVSRYSLPMFMHPRNNALLKPGTTADDYLQERLKEIRLKS